MLNENLITKKYYEKLSMFFNNKDNNISHYLRYKSLNYKTINSKNMFNADKMCLNCGYLYEENNKNIKKISENNITYNLIICSFCNNKN